MALEIQKNGLAITVITTIAELDTLQSEWDALFIASPAASPPLRWKWVVAWWKHYGETYGDGGKGLRVITVRRGTKLIGVFPLYTGRRYIGPISVRRLTTVSAGAAEFEETSVDYLHPLHAPGEEDACAQAIMDAISDPSILCFDQLALPSMSHLAPIARQFEALNVGKRNIEITQVAHCFVCDMRGGFEEYINRLSAKARSRARGLMRKLPKLGIDFAIAATPDDADAYFDQMIELHHKRWHSKGKPGSFAPRHAAFHRSLARDGAVSGDVSVARLSLRGAPLALVYGHRVGDRFCSYQQGVDTEIDSGLHSPGTAVYLMLMQHLAGQGVVEFDLQKGTNEFKEQFSTGTHPLVDVSISRRSSRSMAYQSVRFLARASTKMRKIIKGKLSAHPKSPQDVATTPSGHAGASVEGSA